MTAQSLPHPIALQRPLALRVLGDAVDRARAILAWLQVRRAAHAEVRRSLQAERELARLSPRTLQDIGAPHGLVGQRRWQDEQEAAQVARILNQHGW